MAAARTAFLWFVSVVMDLPMPMSHRRTVPSYEAVVTCGFTLCVIMVDTASGREKTCALAWANRHIAQSRQGAIGIRHGMASPPFLRWQRQAPKPSTNKHHLDHQTCTPVHNHTPVCPLSTWMHDFVRMSQTLAVASRPPVTSTSSVGWIESAYTADRCPWYCRITLLHSRSQHFTCKAHTTSIRHEWQIITADSDMSVTR